MSESRERVLSRGAILPAMTVPRDFEHRYRAVASRDPRFDGYFFLGVTSTGIYCRPSCPARTPHREHVRFYSTSAAAQAAGFRACKRCIPGAVPGSPEWDLRGDVAGRAMRLIADGVVERDGVPGLAARLGYGERQLRRILLADLGAAPLALARAQRTHVARLLLETTDLPVTEIAFAAGFASLRQFNATVREVFDATPTALRERRRRGSEPHVPNRMEIRLARRAPFDFRSLLAFLGLRAIPGVEEVAGDTYRRSLRLPHGPAIVELADDGAAVRCHLDLSDPRDLGPAVARVRRLLDLDADPVAVDDVLGQDPLLGRLVGVAPGRRAPGAVDGPELAIRAVIGQQVSVLAARSIAGRLVAAHGTPLAAPSGGLTHLFPEPSRLAGAEDASLPMPVARRRTLRALAAALADGSLSLDAGADREAVLGRLRELPGIGPWTAGYVALRALGDPDVLLADDLGVRRAARALGLPDDPAALRARAEAWRPWRSYATHHLWASLASSGAHPGDAAGSNLAPAAPEEPVP
jgi:AraC family transcriptional regulator of adaptative response / DNA-3-methyladenine glycosylase II